MSTIAEIITTTFKYQEWLEKRKISFEITFYSGLMIRALGLPPKENVFIKADENLKHFEIKINDAISSKMLAKEFQKKFQIYFPNKRKENSEAKKEKRIQMNINFS